jgi:O-acetyl-ADP-ribose deacetylase (regulator of RNase III)
MPVTIEVHKGDITTLSVDAIVNAANSSLLGGGGVDGAIHRAGGSQILEECKQIRSKQGGCNTGDAVITNAGNLPAKKVIHTVGPVWQGGKYDERSLLASCYTSSLALATKNNIRTIAFPNISTGVYGYPKSQAAEVAVNAVHTFVSRNTEALEKIIFVCFDDENYSIYKTLLEASA